MTLHPSPSDHDPQALTQIIEIQQQQYQRLAGSRSWQLAVKLNGHVAGLRYLLFWALRLPLLIGLLTLTLMADLYLYALKKIRGSIIFPESY